MAWALVQLSLAKKKELRTFSLMPSLASSMSEQELIDLVSYLSTLK
jgi:hypothetical protein